MRLGLHNWRVVRPAVLQYLIMPTEKQDASLQVKLGSTGATKVKNVH